MYVDAVSCIGIYRTVHYSGGTPRVEWQEGVFGEIKPKSAAREMSCHTYVTVLAG